MDLLGGEPVWQVLHALPFAIWGVACALDIVSEFIASVRKNMITVPITVVYTETLNPNVMVMKAAKDRARELMIPFR